MAEMFQLLNVQHLHLNRGLIIMGIFNKIILTILAIVLVTIKEVQVTMQIPIIEVQQSLRIKILGSIMNIAR